MQKAQSVVINKRMIIFILLLFISLHSFSQKKEIIKNSDDYVILNKTIERFSFYKYKRDSIELVDLMLIEKEIPNNIEIQKSIKEVKKEIKNDTIYIKAIADKILYKTFFSKKAKWKKEKKRYKKYTKDLEIIFYKEEDYYLAQLEDNNYLWDIKKIESVNQVFIKEMFKYTRDEIKSLKKEDKLQEIEKLSMFNKSIGHQLFIFSKPIYSKDEKISLISYQYLGNNILYIFEKKDKKWEIKLVLSYTYMVDYI